MSGDLSSVTNLILITPVATFLFVVLLRLPSIARSKDWKPHLKVLGVFAAEIFGIFSVLHFLVRPLAGHVSPISPSLWISELGEILLFLLIFLWIVRTWFGRVVVSLTGRADGKLNRLSKRLERRVRRSEHTDAELRRDNFETFAISVALHTFDRIEEMEGEIEDLKDYLREGAEEVEDRGRENEPSTKERKERPEEERGGGKEEIPQIPSEETRRKSEFEHAVKDLKNALKGSANEEEIVEKFRELKELGCKFTVGETKGINYLKARKTIGEKSHMKSVGKVSPRVKRMAKEAGVDI